MKAKIAYSLCRLAIPFRGGLCGLLKLEWSGKLRMLLAAHTFDAVKRIGRSLDLGQICPEMEIPPLAVHIDVLG